MAVHSGHVCQSFGIGVELLGLSESVPASRAESGRSDAYLASSAEFRFAAAEGEVVECSLAGALSPGVPDVSERDYENTLTEYSRRKIVTMSRATEGLWKDWLQTRKNFLKMGRDPELTQQRGRSARDRRRLMSRRRAQSQPAI